MPQFVSEGAEATRDDPTDEATVELVVRVDSEMLGAIRAWVLDHDGEVIESLDTASHGLVACGLPEIQVAPLCDLDYVRSVERADETIEVLDPGH